jgi:LL-diaminopimelate aminotransferase
MEVRPADRILNMPRYVFDEIWDMKRKSRWKPEEVLDLGVGNPDRRPPEHIIDLLCENLRDGGRQLHRYSTFDGLPEFREAVAAWYERRFGVELDPDSEVLPLVGSKEGIAHLMMAYLNPGDTVIIPTPCYPAYLGAARLLEPEIYEAPLLEENDFRPDLDSIPAEVLDRAKILFLNYPNNPTGALGDSELLRRAVEIGRRHDLIVASDIAYSELWLDPDVPPPGSILQVEGARDVAVEFHSFSKTYNMAGWRIGMLSGNPEVVSRVLRVKSNIDFSVFMALQRTAAQVLGGPQEFLEETRALYRSRRDAVVDGFEKLGWKLRRPRATMYVWDRIPEGHATSFDFIRDLFERTGILLSPGNGFGRPGEGYARISLVAEVEDLERGFERAAAAGYRFDAVRS